VAAKLYYENDSNPAALAGKTIAILATAARATRRPQNLRDSGYTVIVGLDPSEVRQSRRGPTE